MRIALLNLAIFTLSLSSIFAHEAKSATKVREDRPPTLTEIAKANDAAWAKIRSLDMEYETTEAWTQGGKTVHRLRSTGLRWSQAGEQQRLSGRFGTQWTRGSASSPDKCETYDSFEYRDCYLDGKSVREFRDENPTDETRKHLAWDVQENFRATISRQEPRQTAARSDFPEVFRFIRFADVYCPMTLAEIIACGGVSIKGKKVTKEGETLWVIDADYPPRSEYQKQHPMFMRIYVNADKGFLVQRVAYNLSKGDVPANPRQPLAECTSEEVATFQDCGHGIFFPAKVERRIVSTESKASSTSFQSRTLSVSRLSINAPLPKDAFAFRFPENAVVYQTGAGGETTKVMVWGLDNKPTREFASEKAFYHFLDRRRLDKLRKEVADKRDSKKPADLTERGGYYFETKDFAKALAAFSEAIAAAPKSEEAAVAHGARGVIELLVTDEFALAAADFTEVLNWRSARGAAEKDQEDINGLYLVRGMAYASQENRLHLALADLTTAIERKALAAEDTPWPRLVRSAVYLHLNEPDRALADAAEAIKIAPKQAECYAVRCLIYSRKGDKQKETADQIVAQQLYAARKSQTADDENHASFFDHCLFRILPKLETP